MKRTGIIICIILQIIIVMLLVSILIYGIRNNGTISSQIGTQNLKVVKEEIINPLETKNLSLNFTSGKIVVKESEDENIRIVQKSPYDLKEEELMQIKKQDGNVTVERGKNLFKFSFFEIIKDEDELVSLSVLGFGTKYEKIELYIPKEYNKNLEMKLTSGNLVIETELNLEDLKLSTTSGNIVIDNSINVNDIKMGITSGNININNNINANDLKIEQMSGNIKSSYSIVSNTIDIKQTSGNTNLESLVSKYHNLKTTSGNIKINNISGSGDIKLTSGNATLSYINVEDKLNVETNSGNIRIDLNDISANLNARVSSGNIRTNFDLTYKDKNGREAEAKIGAEPYKEVNLKATSGNITINSDIE